jgi:hypothetical protein
MNDQGEIVGMVDVLKLTYATLEQINTMSANDNEGPAWNKFWLSFDNETESMVSGEGSHHPTHHSRSILSPDRRDRLNESVAPGDSASHIGLDSPAHSVVTGGPMEQSPAELPFAFKFKAPSGRVHRVQVIAAQGISTFVANVAAKLGSEVEAIGGVPMVEDGSVGVSGFALSYLDDEGDSVSITTDQDLLEAIVMARQGLRDKVDLFVHDPSQPPVNMAPQSTLELPTPPASSAVLSDVRRRRAPVSEVDEESEDDYSTIRRRKARSPRGGHHAEKEVIAGVPNELLLPGAIVTLAIVIVGVFTITRISSR